jgi:hypothetical protein
VPLHAFYIGSVGKIAYMVSPHFRLRLRDLKELSILSNNNTCKNKKKNRNNSITLGPRQYELLYYFAQNPDTSAYNISPVAGKEEKIRDIKKQAYKDAGNRIERLEDLGLIKEVTEEVIKKKSVTKKNPNPHGAHYYRLSECGIHYIITNNISLKHGILMSLLEHYGGHPLFRYFLYPCIERDTLLKIDDTAIFDHVFSYLHDCYKREEMIMTIIHKGQIDNQTQNGYVTRRLFSLTLAKEDKDSLRSFLKQRPGWNWVDDAKVSKTRDGRIKLSDGLNSAHITLNQGRTEATLFFKGKEPLKFVVQGSDVCTSQPYRSYLRTLDPSRLPPTMSVGVLNMILFKIFLRMRAQQLIFSILSSYVEPGYSAAMQILRHDPKFMQTLKETKDEFEKKYAFFIGKQGPSSATQPLTVQ